ncbi:MAG: hypothetical protein L0228_01765 [Planctomycetes bacterium]|nr:hypothetical protein [Planctomycetota bacterium]
MSQTFEPGTYLGKVKSWSVVKAKTGTPQLALTFQPLGRFVPHSPEADLIECPDLERTIFRAITEKTARRLLADLHLLFEYPHEWFTPLDPESEGAFDFTDREFPAVLTYEEYDGKEREKWNFAAGSGLYGEPLTQAELRKLDLMYGTAKPKRAARKQASEPASESAAPGEPASEPIAF